MIRFEKNFTGFYFYEKCYVCLLLIIVVVSGVQRVHHARDEPAEGAESNPTHHPQGDRANGADHPQEVLFHSDAAQAVHLRGCHDPQIALPRRKVRTLIYFSIKQKRPSFLNGNNVQ